MYGNKQYIVFFSVPKFSFQSLQSHCDVATPSGSDQMKYTHKKTNKLCDACCSLISVIDEINERHTLASGIGGGGSGGTGGVEVVVTWWQDPDTCLHLF